MKETQKPEPFSEKLIERLSSLDRLYQNAFRRVGEYDTRDESADTLLWSKEKSGREAVLILEELLSNRKGLRAMENLKDPAYQGRVRRWRFVLPEKENGYEAFLQVGSQIGSRYPEVQAFLLEEVKRAIDLGFSTEAYYLVVRNAGQKKDDGEKRAYIEESLPLFAPFPERYRVQMDLLIMDYAELRADKAKAVEEDRAEAWIFKSDALDTRLDALREPFGKHGFDYREALKEIDLDRLYAPSITSKIASLASGKTLITVSGIARGDWQVLLDGAEVGSLSLAEKQSVSKTFETVLKDVRRHETELKKRGTAEVFDRDQFSNGKVGVRLFGSTDRKYLFAYALTDGRAKAGVTAQIYDAEKRGNALLGTVTTGADGKAFIAPNPKAGQVLRVEVRHPEMLDKSTFYVYGPQKPGAPAPEQWDEEVLFYPDRIIYRRGQTYKAGLVYRTVSNKGEAKLLKQKEGTVTLFAEVYGDEVEVDKASFATDDNGVAQIAFDIPINPEYTDYHLESDKGDYQSIQVEDYKLSYLNIEIDSIPTGLTEGRVMRVYGKTTDLNGHGVPADVELSYDNNGLKRYAIKTGDDGLFCIETKTNAKGWGTTVSLKATDALGNVAATGSYLKMYEVSLPLEADFMAKPFEKTAIKLSTLGQPYQHLPLGDLFRYRFTASLVGKDGTVYPLGELPIKGEKTFSLEDLVSAAYTLRLESRDYFGTEIREESKEVYVYGEKDVLYFGDQVLFAHKAEDGTLLLASSKPLFVRLSYSLDPMKGDEEIKLKELEPGKLYRLTASEAKSIDGVFAVWEGSSYSSFFGRNGKDEKPSTDAPKIEVLGLADTLTFRPGAQFTKEIQVTDSVGKAAPAGMPVLVTVYDSALDDAGGKLYWPGVVLPDRSDVLIGFGMARTEAMPTALTAVKARSATLNEAVAFDTVAAPQATGTIEAPAVRRNFAENAYFSALLRTDLEGKVKLDFKLPDTQTTFRVKTYAFWPDLKSEAEGEQDLKVEQPLTIDLSLPRYLRYGDKLLGRLRIQNLSETPFTGATYKFFLKDSLASEGTIDVPPKGSATVPFEIEAHLADSLLFRATVLAGAESDAIERIIPMKPNTERYNVAFPITVFGEKGVTLQLQKVEHRTELPALVELYVSPLHLLLSELAKDYDPQEKIQDLSLFALSSKFATFAELRKTLEKHPELSGTLLESARELEAFAGEPDALLARQASPRELSAYYAFLADADKVKELMASYEAELLKYVSPQGGFFFTKEYPAPSVWLTHILLSNLKEAQTYFSPKMTEAAEEGLRFLRQSLGSKQLWYRDYVGLELLLHAYGEPRLTGLTESLQKEYREQVESLRHNYQTASTSTLLRYARYAKVFDQNRYQEVTRFINDRIPYAPSDIDRLLLELFLVEDTGKLRPEVVKFFMSLKQGTMWDYPVYTDAVTLLLQEVKPSTFAKDASLRVGQEVHSLTPYERATGHILFPLYNIPEDGSLNLSWTGLETETVIGGVCYEVEQPIPDITPTGEKLTVYKEIYARRVDNGKSSLVRLSDEMHAKAGEQIVVRYLIEARQDLSLVTLYDRRAAGMEFGYDFRGYGTSDRLWWHYSRRDDADYIFIDYLPKGKHVLELEAVANVGGTFSYGPASVQSYYAPEFAGNSAGGYFITEPYSK